MYPLCRFRPWLPTGQSKWKQYFLFRYININTPLSPPRCAALRLSGPCPSAPPALSPFHGVSPRSPPSYTTIRRPQYASDSPSATFSRRPQRRTNAARDLAQFSARFGTPLTCASIVLAHCMQRARRKISRLSAFRLSELHAYSRYHFWASCSGASPYSPLSDSKSQIPLFNFFARPI